MGRLIVLNRLGIQIVTGKVVAYSDHSITIENDVFFQAVQRTEKRQIVLETDRANKMHIQTGADLIASIRPTEALLALADGAYSKKNATFTTTPYVVRYTGSFDFAQYGDEEERHVFCGNVIDKIPLTEGGMMIVIGWKHSGDSVQRSLYFPFDNFPCINKGVFLTGAVANSRYGPIYRVKQVNY